MGRDDVNLRAARLAVAEARKSKTEPGKTPLFVGAVAVVDGRLLGSAHRGELASGDHAEFTLLEKKLKTQKLAGATIFTTLEPCTERGEDKIPCAIRLIQRRVARVVIGTIDPHRVVHGEGELRLREAGIKVSRFPDELQSELEELNREFFAQHRSTGPSNTKRPIPASLAKPKARSIQGHWLCQYRYPSTDELSGREALETETQIVCFEQVGETVKGTTVHALAHPEDFEGRLIDRYFTGLYFNRLNHHSYHGAFQFILSNSKNRMRGKWLGFNREGNEVITEEWRWEQLIDSTTISADTLHTYWASGLRRNLLREKRFL